VKTLEHTLRELRPGTSVTPNIYAKDFDVLKGALLLRSFWTAFEIVMQEVRCSIPLGNLRNLGRLLDVEVFFPDTLFGGVKWLLRRSRID
jgi:hypothetical protein